jgi:Ca2+-binding RTX toxin-like protein
MSIPMFSMRFAGEMGLSDGVGGHLGMGPRFGIEPGPTLVRIDWGAPDIRTGEASPGIYAPDPVAETQVDWTYGVGTFAIRALAVFPGGARQVERLTAIIHLNEVADQTLTGTSLRDFVIGGDGADTVFGGSGDDWIHGRDGADLLIGGAGDDWLWAGETDDAEDTMIGGVGNDSMAGYEGNDHLRGNTGDDALFGHGGADRLVAGTGADQLTGGAGQDTLLCGVDADSDWVYYYGLDEGGDRIIDFTPGTDRMGLIFTHGLGLGLDASRFVANAAAMTDTGAWIIYNPANGRLQVDLNGTAAGALHDIALLVGAPALGFGDLLVYH